VNDEVVEKSGISGLGIGSTVQRFDLAFIHLWATEKQVPSRSRRFHRLQTARNDKIILIGTFAALKRCATQNHNAGAIGA
jgi:hypothetical protein